MTVANSKKRNYPFTFQPSYINKMVLAEQIVDSSCDRVRMPDNLKDPTQWYLDKFDYIKSEVDRLLFVDDSMWHCCKKSVRFRPSYVK